MLDELVAGVRREEAGARAALASRFGSAEPSQRHEVLDGLAAAGAQGSRPAVELLVELVHRHRLAHPAITTVLVDPADVDDAAQLTLIAVVERIDSFQGRSRFQTWLRAIARNEALQILRRKRRKSEPSGQEVPELDRFVRRLSSVVADQQAVQRALDRLAEPYREVLVLRELEQLGYDEIAARLGVPIGTVRSRLARAREQLAGITWHW